MSTQPRWEPFGLPADTWDNAPEQDGVKWLHLSRRRSRGNSDRAPGSVLINTAALLLGLLAAGLFVVSLAAQYRYIYAEKHQVAPAIIEAVGLDVGMAIFSLLALGLAMAGQSARVERALIVACALGSALMNYAAANGGSPRSVAAYVMPPIFLAIVVDRVVAVVRRHVLGETERSAWAAFGRVALYGLRFALAAPSTATGLRRQVLAMTPLPAAEIEPPTAGEIIPRPDSPCPICCSLLVLPNGSCANCGWLEDDDETDPWTGPDVCPECLCITHDVDSQCPATLPQPPKSPSKTARFLEIVERHHGPFAAIDPADVGTISRQRAHEADLDTGSARAALRRRVLASQNGHGHG